MSIAIAVKIFLLALIFVMTSGTVFSEWGRRHRALVFLASVVAVIGSFYLFSELYNDLKEGAARDVIERQEDNAAFDEARRTGTVEAYRRYKAVWPRGRKVAEADREIARLEKTEQAKIDEERKQREERARQEAARKAEDARKREAEDQRRREEAAKRATRLDANRGAKPLTAAELAFVRGVTRPMPDQSFKECAECPEMVVVPPGEFLMGSPEGEEGRDTDEGPQHKQTIPAPFAVGKFEVTFAEWDACVEGGGCKHKPETDWGRGRQPVMRVSWDDITKEYLPWLNRKVSGRADGPYRLMSEAEWEYAARAGTATRYAFGDSISKSQAQFSDSKTVEVGSFKSNRFGLYDMHGNVWEWVADCWNSNYESKPDDLKTSGKAWTTGGCGGRVLRGGSWINLPWRLRSAIRLDSTPGDRSLLAGFRVARTL